MSRGLSLAVAVALVAIGMVVAVVAAQDADPHADRNVIIVHVVRNGHPAQGRVTIRDDDGHEASCEVNAAGECEITGMTPGRHVVVAAGPDGAVSRARPIMIPEDGKVSLIVQLPAPNAAPGDE